MGNDASVRGRCNAVVIGAGIGGLLAAGILSQRFDRVVILERDVLPSGPENRRGAPQGAHAHGILAVGLIALERMFPGLAEDLVGRGGIWVDAGRDVLVWHYGGFRAPCDAGVRLILASRPLLEWCIRRRIAALPNVVLDADVAVAGLLGELRERVTGVSLASGDAIHGDLVVDATGRGERSNRWLSALDFDVPGISVIRVRLGYATRLLRRRSGDLPAGLACAVAPSAPGEKRFGAAIPIEGDRWLVTLGGFHGDHPTRDPAEYQDFAESLPHSLIADLLRRAEPLTGIATFQFPASRRRHFERLATVPSGYLAIGDAICSFNPVYGQGITVAAMEALALGWLLDRYPGTGPDLVQSFYRHAANAVGGAWGLARGADFMYSETKGRKPLAVGLRNWYMRRVILSSQVSPKVSKTLIRVQHLLVSPHALTTPTTALAVLKTARVAEANAAMPTTA